MTDNPKNSQKLKHIAMSIYPRSLGLSLTLSSVYSWGSSFSTSTTLVGGIDEVEGANDFLMHTLFHARFLDVFSSLVGGWGDREII